MAIQAAKLADIQGIVEAREADLPLIVRTPRGFGQIIFVAADLDQGPLGKWSDRPLLLAKLLDLPPGRGEEPSDNAALMHYRLHRPFRPTPQRTGRVHRRDDHSLLASWH